MLRCLGCGAVFPDYVPRRSHRVTATALDEPYAMCPNPHCRSESFAPVYECGHCGSWMGEHETHCPECGWWECQDCGEWWSGGLADCPECGEEL